jgi:hypothetical protein
MSKRDTDRKERIVTTGPPSSREDQAGQSSTPPKITDEMLSQKTRNHVWIRDDEGSVFRALDEAKDNIRKSIDEARREIPRYTQIVIDYQEQTIQAAREIADSYLESQKEIIRSFQSTWVPNVDKVFGAFWNSWLSARSMTEAYTQVVRNIADNMITTTRLTNNMIFANMQGLKTSMEQTKHNSEQISWIGANTARKFEQTTSDAANAAKRAVVSDTPPRINVEKKVG